MSKYGEPKLKRKNTFHYKYVHLNLKSFIFFFLQPGYMSSTYFHITGCLFTPLICIVHKAILHTDCYANISTWV